MPPKPFQCHFPECTASYHRKEHLRRHEAHHSRTQVFKCSSCNQEFGRRYHSLPFSYYNKLNMCSDTLHRHKRQIHGAEPIQKKSACVTCRDQKARCEGVPCENCVRRGIDCSLLGDGERRPNTTHQSELSRPEKERKERHYISLYFRHFHPHWPFVHQEPFNGIKETPLLVQSVVVIGMWLSEENARSRALELHRLLGDAISQQPVRTCSIYATAKSIN